MSDVADGPGGTDGSRTDCDPGRARGRAARSSGLSQRWSRLCGKLSNSHDRYLCYRLDAADSIDLPAHRGIHAQLASQESENPLLTRLAASRGDNQAARWLFLTNAEGIRPVDSSVCPGLPWRGPVGCGPGLFWRGTRLQPRDRTVRWCQTKVSCCPTDAAQSCCQVACAVAPGLLHQPAIAAVVPAMPGAFLEPVALSGYSNPPPIRPPIQRP